MTDLIISIIKLVLSIEKKAGVLNIDIARHIVSDIRNITYIWSGVIPSWQADSWP